MKLGKTLRRFRHIQEFTQYDLAYSLGISQITYSRMERDLRKPTDEELKKIGEILGISPEEILATAKGVVIHIETADRNAGIVYNESAVAEDTLKEVYNTLLAEKDKLVAEKDKQLQEKNEQLVQKDEQIRTLQEQLQRVTERLLELR